MHSAQYELLQNMCCLWLHPDVLYLLLWDPIWSLLTYPWIFAHRNCMIHLESTFTIGRQQLSMLMICLLLHHKVVWKGDVFPYVYFIRLSTCSFLKISTLIFFFRTWCYVQANDTDVELSGNSLFWAGLVRIDVVKVPNELNFIFDILFSYHVLILPSKL